MSTNTEAICRPIIFSGEMVNAILDGRKTQTRRVMKPQFGCPYGKVGDDLWVREGFRLEDGEYFFRAEFDRSAKAFGQPQPARKWKPSIYMPRTACRLTLEVTNVRVERVQDIREADAVAEGAPEPPAEPLSGNPAMWPCDYRESFRQLWDSINDKRGFGWDSNPWVWVVDFVKKEGEHVNG